MLELAFYVGLYTTHISGSGWNEDNRLVAVEVESIVVGHMVNSMYNDSWIVAYNHRFNDWSGVLLGGASGYDYGCFTHGCDPLNSGSDDIVPISAPYIHWQNVHILLQANAVSVVYGF
jgi:hypothetical protein